MHATDNVRGWGQKACSMEGCLNTSTLLLIENSTQNLRFIYMYRVR